MRDFSSDHRWLSLNTATVRKQGDLLQLIDACARVDIVAYDGKRPIDLARQELGDAHPIVARLAARG